jgi:hypothetical protein
MPDTDFAHQIATYLRARITLVVVITVEEERVVNLLRQVCEQWNPPRPCLSWDIVDGFSVVAGKSALNCHARDPIQALEGAEKAEENAVILLRDFHEFWTNPQVKRKLRNLAQKFKYNRRSLVITTPSLKVPDEIKDDAVVIHFLPPTAEELEQELDRLLQTGNIKSALTPLGKEDNPGKPRDDPEPGKAFIFKGDSIPGEAR